jgi:hypothetical protein
MRSIKLVDKLLLPVLLSFFCYSATLYMAVNEIRASAKETGMKFWEYGI